MRRALRKALPAISHWFGLKPWEVAGGPEALTFGEIEEYQRWLTRQTKGGGK